MTQSRQTQISLDATPFYHCYVRCVRRAFLCGDDFATGANYDHRKQWIVSRLKFLSYVYAIDICAYAVMSNHYHVVLHVDKAKALSWGHEEVAERWMQLHKGHVLVDQWLKDPNSVDKATWDVVQDILEEWRSRLYDISWFMRGVNETIARMANEEEKSHGRFWEGRFKSQALLDETALLSCMAYVDLNPVRAGMAESLVDSDFTSVQQRLYAFAKNKRRKNTTEKQIAARVDAQQTMKSALNLDTLPEAPLMPFHGSAHTNIHSALPFTWPDYIQLVEETGRAIREDKRGFIVSHIPPILSQLDINPDEWIQHVKHFNRRYGAVAGSAKNIYQFAELVSSEWQTRCWFKGVGFSKKLQLNNCASSW